VNPENVSEIAAQLAALSSNENLRERLRGAGFLRAEKFDWRIAARETLSVYERAAARVKFPRGTRALQKNRDARAADKSTESISAAN
jgi:hypothetical protein